MPSLHWRRILAAAGLFALPFALLLPTRGQLTQGPGSAMRAVWTQLIGFPGGATVAHLALGKLGASTLLVATSATSGPFVSVDRGSNWTAACDGLPRGGLGSIRIRALAVAPHDASMMYVAVESPSSVPRPMLYWTANAGVSWQPRASIGQERISCLAFQSGSDQLYLATRDDLLKAFVFEGYGPNGGAPRAPFARGIDDFHWLSIAAFGPSVMPTTLYASGRALSRPERASFAGVDEQAVAGFEDAEWFPIYVGTQGSGLQVYVDAGAGLDQPVRVGSDADSAWLRASAAIHAIAVHEASPRRMFAGTDRGVYVSDDGGISWARTGHALRGDQVLALEVVPGQPDTLFAGLGGGGVWFSRDGGVTWQVLGVALGHAVVNALVLEPEELLLYAATDHGIWRLRLRGDWSSVETRP